MLDRHSIQKGPIVRALFVSALDGTPNVRCRISTTDITSLRSRDGDHLVVHRDRSIKYKHPALDIRRAGAGTGTNAGAVSGNDGSYHRTSANRIDSRGTIRSPAHVLGLSPIFQCHTTGCGVADGRTVGVALEDPNRIRITLCIERKIATSNLERICQIDSGPECQPAQFTGPV